MRIAFTGSHRVGKTTLAEEIGSNLPNFGFKNEPYIELEEAGYLFSEIPTLDDYMEQFNYSVKQLKDSENNVVFDRCPLDILAYIEAVRKTENTQTYYDEMTNAMSLIDIIVFVPLESPDLIVCQESDLPALRREVNDILSNWIWDLNNEVLEVKGTLEQRKKQVLNRIHKEAL
ncbi:AAA family ATPase [Parapedobacter sp. GCM10030251]|uniref:AAA family ATPase n=1 Tax=Parapedobacter sp. GCM10030251 TaxID=3273419 RepID=UPI00361E0836